MSNRKDWIKKYYSYITKNTHSNTFQNLIQIDIPDEFKKSEALSNRLKPFKYNQPADEEFAMKYLTSFLYKRSTSYVRHISKPLESRMSCSRLSVYLAAGMLSVRQVYKEVTQMDQTFKKNKFQINAFLDRLRWRCHFIQKFEQDCSYEYSPINKAYEALEFDYNPEHIQAWKDGQTGYPLIDACMRCLTSTGWINFRMRAVLVSFFCHTLFQDWKQGVYHLANLFIDYEPGIHFPQFQMQAGITGVNTIRIYNPVKQSYAQDPDGVFIKKWVSELKTSQKILLHEPWKIRPLETEIYHFNCTDNYYLPIVDLQKANKKAREKALAF